MMEYPDSPKSDRIYVEECSSTTAIRLPNSQLLGVKRLRIELEFNDSDSDEELDQWFRESVTKKVGLWDRSFWMHPMNKRRESDGEYVTVCLPLRQYPDKFFKYHRMSVSTYDYILENIKGDITKWSNRPSISPGERLAVTLRYLSTGMSFQAIAQSFMMDGYTVGKIVRETCEKIYEKMSCKHLRVPSKEEFLVIAENYEKMWNFPNCLGSLDGKHIRIRCPKQSGSMYFNYKLFYSIVLQAVADAHCRFLFIDVGAYGKQSDGGVFAASSLSKFVSDERNFPQDRVIEGLNVPMPYCFLCDDAYPLKPNLMKPFSGMGLNPLQDIYNGRLSRARRCVECAFGILVNKWRVLLKSIETTDEHAAENIVKCATVLHNVVIDEEGIDQTLMTSVREKVMNRESRERSLQTGRRYNRSSHSAVLTRNLWMKYFNSDAGAVAWQNRYIKNLSSVK